MKYPCETRELKIGAFDFRVLEIKSSDALFNQLVSLGPEHDHVKDERIPYWADLWPSAIGLAQHIVSGNVVNPAASVLEIGCGLGLPGIAAGKMGAQVTFTDYMDDALEMARENWSLNHSSPAKFEILDWRNPDITLAADILLASDVAYEQKAFAPLLNLFQLMVKPGGTILLSEPGRKYMTSFFEALEKEGYSTRRFSYPVVWRGINSAVGVYEIKKLLNDPAYIKQPHEAVMESARLLYRKFTEADAEKIFELCGDSGVLQYTGEKAMTSKEEALLLIRNEYKHQPKDLGRYAVLLKETGEFVGWCGIRRNENGEDDIGFRLLKDFRGKGYATEATKAFLSFGFNRFGLTRIFGKVLQSNVASVSVLQKAGMKNPQEVILHDAPAFIFSMKK